jgi:hypothetical protein
MNVVSFVVVVRGIIMNNYAAVLLGFFMFGCAGQKSYVKAPSSAVVAQNLNEAKQKINEASAAVRAAGGNVTELNSLSDRMERKNVIITRWLELHSHD